MAYTQTMIDTLKEAIATGAREVWYADKKVIYRTLLEMMQTLTIMEEEVNPVTPNLGSRRYGSYYKNRC